MLDIGNNVAQENADTMPPADSQVAEISIFKNDTSLSAVVVGRFTVREAVQTVAMAVAYCFVFVSKCGCSSQHMRAASVCPVSTWVTPSCSTTKVCDFVW